METRSHIDQITRNSISLLNIHDRVIQLRLNHVFNIFNNRGAPYLAQKFTRASSAHSYRTRSSNCNFVVPRVTGIASKTFFYNAISYWNALPPQIQSIGDRSVFKLAVKKHLAARASRQE